MTQSGWEVLVGSRGREIRGRRVGLLTHAAAVDRGLHPVVDRAAALPGIRLAALFGPEHGIRGEAQAGEPVPHQRDPALKIPIYSLYGQASTVGKNLDSAMRRIDTRRTGKAPGPGMLAGIDLLLVDLQDVGCRVYTYAATMVYAMEAAVRSGVEVVVLDRPNPISGILCEGPVLEDEALYSPVGLLPVPLRHGLTLGELALLANASLLEGRARLRVIPMRGWKRSLWFDGTSLPWVSPSPNMPTLETATVYPGQVLFEGTNVSEGRGTTRPFEAIGAPWMDGQSLAERMNRLRLPGVRFRSLYFTPTFSKFAGRPCSGLQLHVVDRRRYLPVATALHLLRAIMDCWPDRFRFHAPYFDRVAGMAAVRLGLLAGASPREIEASFAPGLARFRRTRAPFLLYR